MKDIVTTIKHGTLTGGSDASVQNGRSGGSWRVQVSRTSTGITGEGPIDRDPQTMHSTRGERGIKIGALWTILKIARRTNNIREMYPVYR